MTLQRTTLWPLLCLAVCAAPAAANEITGIAVERGTSVKMTFSASTPPVSASISENKSRITLSIPGVSIRESAREVRGDGSTVREIRTKVQRDTAYVYIELMRPRGFAIQELPWSRASVLYLVDWANATPAMDNFALGLLSYESGAMEAALEYFSKARALGSPEATYMEGITHLRLGNVSKARESLVAAYNGPVRLPDAVAALGELSDYATDSAAAQRLRRQFASSTGFEPAAHIAKLLPAAENSEPPSIALLLKDADDIPLAADSLPAPDTTAADSALALANLLAGVSGDTAKQAGSTSSAIPITTPSWLKMVAGTLLALFALTFGGFFMLYRRWKKKKTALVEVPAPPAESAPESPYAPMPATAQREKAEAANGADFSSAINQAVQSAMAKRAAETYKPKDDGTHERTVVPAAEAYGDPEEEEAAEEEAAPSFAQKVRSDMSDLAKRLFSGSAERALSTRLSQKRADPFEMIDAEELPSSARALAALAKDTHSSTSEIEFRKRMNELAKQPSIASRLRAALPFQTRRE